MYPTPPSEEQTHFSPVNHPCPELSSNLTSYGSNQTRDMTSGPMNEQFEIEIEESLCSPRPEPLLVWKKKQLKKNLLFCPSEDILV